jgi:hypothetical protein
MSRLQKNRVVIKKSQFKAMLVKMWEFFLQAFIANSKETYEGKN